MHASLILLVQLDARLVRCQPCASPVAVPCQSACNPPPPSVGPPHVASPPRAALSHPLRSVHVSPSHPLLPLHTCVCFLHGRVGVSLAPDSTPEKERKAGSPACLGEENGCMLSMGVAA